MNNYYELLNIKYKNHIIIYLILIIIFILLIVSLNIDSYDEYKTYGVYKNKTLIVSIPVINSDNLLTGKYLQINNKKYNYEINKISDLYVENYINYEDFEINIEKSFLENEVVEITFYSNKEKMIKKIKRVIF